MVHAKQAHAFQEGLKLSPNDKVLRQGFWDSISLVSQSRVDTTAGPAGIEEASKAR